MLRGQNASRTRAVVSHFAELIVGFFFMKTNNRCLISFSNFVMVLINRWQYFLSSSSVCGLWKINKCLFIPNCTRKIMWLRINNIHGKITRWLIIIKHKQSARIKCKNNLCKPCIRSKHRVRAICNDIFASLRRKKVQSPAKQFKERSICVQIMSDEMEASFPRFNHVCF